MHDLVQEHYEKLCLPQLAHWLGVQPEDLARAYQ